jgi:hypothetical protein
VNHFQAFLVSGGQFFIFQTGLGAGLNYGQGVPEVMSEAGDQGFAHHLNPGSSFRLVPQLLNHHDGLFQILQQKVALPLIILELPLQLPPSKDFLIQGMFFI